MPAPKKPGPVKARVESALKTTIESELKRAAVDKPAGGGAAGFFSRGAIFSKSNGFSKGVIFSRQASDIDRLDEVVLPSIVDLDDASFAAFAERLGSLQQVKNLKSNIEKPR